VSPLWELLKDSGAKDVRVDVLKFTPAGDFGVTKALADALGGTSEERAGLAQAFAQLKQGYEAEVAREGKSNNLAAAMAFFIAPNVMAYHQTDMSSDADMTKLMNSLQQAMAQVPAFARTIEESGSYSINGDTLTITPQTSKTTLRNLNGVVQETHANPLERVAYNWTTHFFEGIGETNLVLQPPAATSRGDTGK